MASVRTCCRVQRPFAQLGDLLAWPWADLADHPRRPQVCVAGSPDAVAGRLVTISKHNESNTE